MGRPERVVHEQVGSVGELVGEARVVLRLTRMKAGVLEDGDPRIVQECAQMLLDGPQREGRILPLRPAEMRAEPDFLRAAVEQEPDRRQRRADARVVRHSPVLQRHVEVDAREHALAGDVGVPDGPRPVHGQSRRCDRSTSRQL
jgi:hypothetical protein